MSTKLKLINILLLLILSFVHYDLANSRNLVFDNNNKNLIIKNKTQYNIETGIDRNKDDFWDKIFDDKSSDEIQSFLEELPIKNPNLLIQNLIYKILISQKNIDKLNVSPDEDILIFENLIKKLFETGRLNEIEILFSQNSELKNNEYILKKMIEGNLLRNRHSEACKILENKVKGAPKEFGKIMIICDILSEKFDEAKLGLSLLKEQNIPGDIFFIDLAYSLMSEGNISNSEQLKKNLEEVKELNPIIMSSLQFADISPSYQQIEGLSTIGLLFVLSNPSVDTDLKIYCSEILFKQGRINIEMLSEAYQLSRFENKEIENSINLYKTLSPVKARPLLYQSLLRDSDPELKLRKILALIKISINDNLLPAIARLVSKEIPFEQLVKSKDESYLISKMLQSKKNYSDAKRILLEDDNTYNRVTREISVDIAQYLNNKIIDNNLLDRKIEQLQNPENKSSESLKKIIMILISSVELDQGTMNKIQNINFLDESKIKNNDLNHLFLAEKFSKRKDVFNSIKLLFKIVGNKHFKDLNTIQCYSIIVILKNLGLNSELVSFSDSILI